MVPTPALTYLLQYQDPNNTNNWITYDEKYGDITAQVWNHPVGLLQAPNIPSSLTYVDPRTSRFGAPEMGGGGLYGVPGTMPVSSAAWIDPTNNVLWTDRPDYFNGTSYNLRTVSYTHLDVYKRQPPHLQNKNGSVLVIALLFTALILGLLIAFLSNSTLKQMASKTSSCLLYTSRL